ncbi:hypothetical protein [Corynebacterium cystitidis]|uniref:hypothetical protein n=1 Tax=Corynebacterium cystitidis TaxID=35757 RepID=UPI00211DA859|nr:hypothetical protein [Corynebacterium cystitidis]
METQENYREELRIMVVVNMENNDQADAPPKDRSWSPVCVGIGLFLMLWGTFTVASLLMWQPSDSLKIEFPEHNPFSLDRYFIITPLLTGFIMYLRSERSESIFSLSTRDRLVNISVAGLFFVHIVGLISQILINTDYTDRLEAQRTAEAHCLSTSSSSDCDDNAAWRPLLFLYVTGPWKVFTAVANSYELVIYFITLSFVSIPLLMAWHSSRYIRGGLPFEINRIKERLVRENRKRQRIRSPRSLAPYVYHGGLAMKDVKKSWCKYWSATVAGVVARTVFFLVIFHFFGWIFNFLELFEMHSNALTIFFLAAIALTLLEIAIEAALLARRLDLAVLFGFFGFLFSLGWLAFTWTFGGYASMLCFLTLILISAISWSLRTFAGRRTIPDGEDDAESFVDKRSAWHHRNAVRLFPQRRLSRGVSHITKNWRLVYLIRNELHTSFDRSRHATIELQKKRKAKGTDSPTDAP